MGSNVAPATQKEEAQGSHQNNSFKNRNNLEKHIIKKRELKVNSFPFESRAQEPPSPSPGVLDPQLPKEPQLHLPPTAAALFHLLLHIFIKHYCLQISPTQRLVYFWPPREEEEERVW